MYGTISLIFKTILIASLLLSSSFVYGGKAPGSENRSLQRPLLNITVGQVGVDKNLNEPWRFGMEYRFSPLTRFRLVPSTGVAVGENDASFIYTELRRDFRLTGDWLLTPSFGLGLFNNRPDLDLGKPVEFRSGLEISRQFGGGYRLGAAIFHLSNGGLADKNPGTEAVVVSFSVPLGGG
ncbi:acyloxyacyl hydrolase [Marinobacter sp.]|uniref:acyloxyacyl hydrolase n=1 Tax=Marinobacter sp. TaxID=50741 RepID=UPI002B499D11|nr:acyloxyacyl hydrolase [Marinobacter sp.]HKK56010.1 acyloxyacyl hydrolase [Marinobacter sp.]